jgi:cell division septal protein FtsQ
MSLRRRRRSRLRQFWAVAVVALVVAAIAGYALVSWSGFHPRHVRVVGNRIVPTGEILAQARVDLGSNMWLANTGAMASRIQRIPYILSARVYRRPPATITIAVTERTPFANMTSDGASALVDRTLRVLALDEDPGLPTLMLDRRVRFVPGTTVHQDAARALLDTLTALREHGADATTVALDNGDVVATLQGHVQILLGDEASAAQATSLVEPILTRFALLGRPVRLLDLRSPNAPVVTESEPVRVRRPKARVP